MRDTLRIFISAAERSGDAHAARLVGALRERSRALDVFGFGGELLRGAGVRVVRDTVGMASMGTGFLGHLGDIVGSVRAFDRILRRERPDAVIFVDSPGLHFLFARIARWRGVRVIDYICPQIWAWAPWRRGKVLRYADLLLPILPFETEVFANDRVPVVPVGHPLGETLAEVDPHGGETLRSELDIDSGARVIGLLPGSRTQEVASLAPLYRGVIDRLGLDPERDRVVVSCFRESFRDVLESAFDSASVPVEISHVDARRIVQASDFVIVASGTASLEVAFFETPMVVLYHVSPLLRALSRRYLVVPYFSLPNLLGAADTDGAPVVHEQLCRGDEADEVAAIVRALLEDGEAQATQRARLRAIRERVLAPGAADRAARAVLEFLGAGGDESPSRRATANRSGESAEE